MAESDNTQTSNGNTVNTNSNLQKTYNFCPWDGYAFRHDEEQECTVCGNPRQIAPFKKKPNWRKILYEKQPYSDNYVGEEFLQELIRNANLRSYDYWTLVQDSAIITQHITAVALFVVVFTAMYQEMISSQHLYVLIACITIFGYGIRIFVDRSITWNLMQDSIKMFILLFCTTLGLSPVLRTLTEPFSKDTIWALTFLLLILHIFFHDYGYAAGITEKFEGTVSLNAAIFASILLSSKLHETMDVFTFIFFFYRMVCSFSYYETFFKLFL